MSLKGFSSFLHGYVVGYLSVRQVRGLLLCWFCVVVVIGLFCFWGVMEET